MAKLVHHPVLLAVLLYNDDVYAWPVMGSRIGNSKGCSFGTFILQVVTHGNTSISYRKYYLYAAALLGCWIFRNLSPRGNTPSHTSSPCRAAVHHIHYHHPAVYIHATIHRSHRAAAARTGHRQSVSRRLAVGVRMLDYGKACGEDRGRYSYSFEKCPKVCDWVPGTSKKEENHCEVGSYERGDSRTYHFFTRFSCIMLVLEGFCSLARSCGRDNALQGRNNQERPPC